MEEMIRNKTENNQMTESTYSVELTADDEFSEVDLLRWIAQQSADPEHKNSDYSDRIADAYGQKAGE